MCVCVCRQVWCLCLSASADLSGAPHAEVSDSLLACSPLLSGCLLVSNTISPCCLGQRSAGTLHHTLQDCQRASDNLLLLQLLLPLLLSLSPSPSFSLPPYCSLWLYPSRSLSTHPVSDAQHLLSRYPGRSLERSATMMHVRQFSQKICIYKST